jgi:hypothetical protein
MRSLGLLFIWSSLILLACSDTEEVITPCIDPPANTRYFEFIHDSGLVFLAWTTDPVVLELADQQLSLPVSERNKHMNGGVLRVPEGCSLNFEVLRVPEGCSLNFDWSWYFDPGDWSFADQSIELCDGNPQFVEENLDEYIRTGRYCPWGSKVLREVGKPF